MPAKIITLTKFAHLAGFSFTAPIGVAGDSPGGQVCQTRLFEDSIEIGPGHVAHKDIEQFGNGRFSHWGNNLYFSSSDGSSPINNGRTYQLVLGAESRSRTELDQSLFFAMQRGILKYKYKGVWCCKSPIDLALYQMLIWEEQPQTILELGSLEGGSALWLADILRTYKINGQIHSLDIAGPPPINDPLVKFYNGDIFQIGNTWSKQFISSLPRPILVIEDAGHQYEMTRAAIEFMSEVLVRGEYLIIEDGIATPMDSDKQFNGGPLRAIDECLTKNQKFEVDRTYCDFFGQNVTWNTDGFLRRV